MNRQTSLITLLILAISLSGCTLIRYVDGDDDDPQPGEVEPRYVQALILVDLPRGAANIMPGYANYIAYVQAALSVQHIEVTRTAIAPLYRQQRDRPLLLYGEDDAYAPFGSLPEALAYYISDEGLSHLDSTSDADGENLAVLGLNMDRESVFNPRFAPPETRPYFHEADHGFIVFYLSASARKCAHDSPECALDQKTPAEYFTATDPETGFATWLEMTDGTGFSPSKIVHIAIFTPEGMNYDTFADKCLREPQFPANHLDVIEPSDRAYFGPFMKELRRRGGQGIEVDFCTAFSSRVERSAINTAGQISRAIRQ